MKGIKAATMLETKNNISCIYSNLDSVRVRAVARGRLERGCLQEAGVARRRRRPSYFTCAATAGRDAPHITPTRNASIISQTLKDFGKLCVLILTYLRTELCDGMTGRIRVLN